MNRGFSIIETLLVVVLVLALWTLSTAFYSRFLLQNAASNTADQVAATLRKAQVYSMMGKQGGKWGVHYTNSPNSFTLFQGETYLTRNPAFDQVLVLNPNVQVSGLTDVIFNKGNGMTDTPLTIIITAGNTVKNVLVSAEGGVSK